MPTLTDVRNEIGRALESAQVPKPFYAVAGVGDLAVEKLRALQLERRIAGLTDEARTLPGRVGDVRGRVRALPTDVAGAAVTAGDRAGEFYDGLTVRGRNLVGRIAAQQATRDLVDGAREVVRSAKATATTAEQGAERTRTSARRTATTAKKTTESGRRAAADAAGTTGTTKARAAKTTKPAKRSKPGPDAES
ncbi:MAG: hypothetical protein J2P24_02810 [Streptosporangiales bacterium]|nr:hypothetical protein [Streptosporangiales bacterium]MBO0889468.1 hypothetical protein [Acidothermales bacterium]